MSGGKAALLVNTQYLLECQEMLGVKVDLAKLVQTLEAVCGQQFKQRIAVYSEGDLPQPEVESAFLKSLRLAGYRVDRLQVPETAKAAHCQSRACKYFNVDPLRLNCVASGCAFSSRARSILPRRNTGIASTLATRMLQLCYRQDVKTFVVLAGDEYLDQSLDLLCNDEPCEVHLAHFDECGLMAPETRAYATKYVDLSGTSVLEGIKAAGEKPPGVVHVDVPSAAGGVPGAKKAQDIPWEIRMMDMCAESLNAIGKDPTPAPPAATPPAEASPRASDVPAPAPAPAATLSSEPANAEPLPARAGPPSCTPADSLATANFFDTLSMMPAPSSPPTTTAGAAPPALGDDDFFGLSKAKKPPVEEQNEQAPPAEPERRAAKQPEADLPLPLPLPLPTLPGDGAQPEVEKEAKEPEASAVQPAAAAPTAAPTEVAPAEPKPLPPGWTEYTDPRTQRSYYAWTDAAGQTKTVWKRPEESPPGYVAPAAEPSQAQPQQQQAQPTAQEAQQAKLQQMVTELKATHETHVRTQHELQQYDAQIAQLRRVHEQGGVLNAQQQQYLANLMQTRHQVHTKCAQMEQQVQVGKQQVQAEQQRIQQEAQLRAQQEAQLRAQQEAQLRAQQEAQLRAQQEAQLKAQQEAQLKAQQQQQLLQQQQQQQQLAQQQQQQQLAQQQQQQQLAQQQQPQQQQQQQLQQQINEYVVRIQEMQRLHQQGQLPPAQQALMQQMVQQVQLAQQRLQQR
eukprot:TRINITY_DN3749_c1_g1_i1.p1 TRINITY_DN3749_c1_g1~~TRINITY_DN3749_c1_g1_i1.p1  ORF type:complete len:736 (+),score=254.98 TRINITY_DN3749_c1_g1_i1:85-2292(+)